MQLRQGKQFLNQESTLANLKAQIQNRAFKILHLATHAEFYPGSPDKSYIQLWDTKIRLNQLDEVGFDNYPVDLLVLSSCRTGLGDDRDKYGFAGLAIQVGVRAVLASIWYISDEATTALMTDFYRQLQTSPTKAEALRMAQLAMLKGRIKPEATTTRGNAAVQPAAAKDYSHPYFWGGFTMIGNPW
jgi:CHAT domain-containing protein